MQDKIELWTVPDLVDSYVRVWHDATTVKNSALIEISSPNNEIFILSHYATNILTVRNKKVLDIKPVSMSSTRAINQALEFIGIKSTAAQIRSEFKKSGKYVPPIGAY